MKSPINVHHLLVCVGSRPASPTTFPGSSSPAGLDPTAERDLIVLVANDTSSISKVDVAVTGSISLMGAGISKLKEKYHASAASSSAAGDGSVSVGPGPAPPPRAGLQEQHSAPAAHYEDQHAARPTTVSHLSAQHLAQASLRPISRMTCFRGDNAFRFEPRWQLSFGAPISSFAADAESCFCGRRQYTVVGAPFRPSRRTRSPASAVGGGIRSWEPHFVLRGGRGVLLLR